MYPREATFFYEQTQAARADERQALLAAIEDATISHPDYGRSNDTLTVNRLIRILDDKRRAIINGDI